MQVDQTNDSLEKWRSHESSRRREEYHVLKAIMKKINAQTTIRDGVPYVLKVGNKTGVLCLSEKVGSTALKLLVLKAFRWIHLI